MCSVLRISVFAACFVLSLAVAPKSVHLALETSIHIEPKDSNNTYKVINKISKFLQQIKHAIKPALKKHIGYRSHKPKKYLINFLKDVAHAILYFGPRETGWFFKKLYEEINSYLKYKGSGFADIVKNPVVRRYLMETLDEWSQTTPIDMKIMINNYLKRVTNENTAVIRLVYSLNEYYGQKDVKKMKIFVRKLKNCTKERDIKNVIRDAVYTLIIQHYDRMNYTTRMRITDEINRLGEHEIQRRFINQGTNLNSTSDNITDKVPETNTVAYKNASVTNTYETKKANTDETEHKDIIGNTSVSERHVSRDVELTKQNYSVTSQSVPLCTKSTTLKPNDVPYDIKFKAFVSEKGVRQPDFIYIKSKTKRRLKKLTTTTAYVSETTTQKTLKRFKLKDSPKIDNETSMNTTVKQDITTETSRNITSVYVPIDIINGTQNISTVPRAIDDVTKTSSQDIYTGTSNNPTLPQDISNGTSNPTLVPQNNEVSNISTHVPQVIKNETSMRMIPVPQNKHKKGLRVETIIPKYSNTTRGLRVIDIKLRNERSGYPKFKPFNPQDIKKVYENTDNPFIKNRQKYYLPPKAKLALRKKEIIDIEDRLDNMHIDRK